MSAEGTRPVRWLPENLLRAIIPPLMPLPDAGQDTWWLLTLTDFNLELLRYLVWYNLERAHFSLPTPCPAAKSRRLLSPVTTTSSTPPVQYVLARYMDLTVPAT